MTKPEEKSPQATGGCLCGGVRYAIHGPLREVVACHCAMCRRLTTHFGAYTACAPDELEMIQASKLRWYRSSPGARRGFCSRCGSQLFWEPAHKRHISIAAGSLNQPTGLKLARHIYTQGKGDYYEITDGLPQDA